VAKLTKRAKLINEKVEAGKLYAAEEAFAVLKDVSTIKFVEAVDVAVILGVDPRKSDQAVRGATVLPNGTGKSARVAVFAQGANADAAAEAGADIIGMDDLAARIKAGERDVDGVIATPDAMRVVGQLGQVLGPRGLMPNPKVGTVTADVAGAVRNAKAGQVRYRTDKKGIIHCTIGKVNFQANALKENRETLRAELKKAKPSTSNGVYLKKITVSSTMGSGLTLDPGSLYA